ncbi:hypothetical protein BCVP_CDS0235 [Bacillus phage BC-VP]|nr:hypothetical protein BCVP_CDS0235 [Bacillus phage BC-VP]
MWLVIGASRGLKIRAIVRGFNRGIGSGISIGRGVHV